MGDAVFLNVDRRVMVGGFNSKDAIFKIILMKSREEPRRPSWCEMLQIRCVHTRGKAFSMSKKIEYIGWNELLRLRMYGRQNQRGP